MVRVAATQTSDPNRICNHRLIYLMPPKKRPARPVVSPLPASGPSEEQTLAPKDPTPKTTDRKKSPETESPPRGTKESSASHSPSEPAAGKLARPGKKAAADSWARAKKPAVARKRVTTASRNTPAEGLRILMVTPEAHPFAKTGGLAEVTAALPAALSRLGHAVTLVLPRYRGVAPAAPLARTIEMPLGPRTLPVGFVEQTTLEGVRVVLADIPQLFDRDGLYGYDGHDFSDNAVRFGALSRAALEYARLTEQRPDIIHAHDWQTGLVPVYQKIHFAGDPIVGGVPVVFTIHNLAFQGTFGPDTLPSIGLGWEVFHHQALEHWGNISLLKGGVNFSEKITTVSPTYAREILTPEFGFGFEGVLRRRSDDLVGILNGIDTERWNPASDPFAAPYDAGNLVGKRTAKATLLRELRLPSDDGALARPVIGLISRLTHQKGFDLVGAAAEALMSLDATWVMLGSGERQYEDLWRAMAVRHPERVSATIGFDERLAHLIEAGADMFLMPSRFEPCGLNQLYSLRYGTVPIVRGTGGLEDTVTDAAGPGGNGVKFADANPTALLSAVRRALGLFEDRARWDALQRAGMAADPSWDVSAREYVKVYRQLQG